MPISDSYLANEVFQLNPLQVARHHLAFDVWTERRRVSNLAAKFHACHCGLQIIWMGQGIGVDEEGLGGVWSRATNLASTVRSINRCTQSAGAGWWCEFGCCFRTADRYLNLASLHIRSIEFRITLPEEGSLAPVVAYRKRLLVLPNTSNTKMILKILTNTWKMLNDRYSQTVQLSVIANAREHQNFWRVHRALRQNDLEPRMDALYFSVISNLHTGGSLVLQCKPGDHCVSEHRQIWPIHEGEHIGTKDREALSIAHS